MQGLGDKIRLNGLIFCHCLGVLDRQSCNTSNAKASMCPKSLQVGCYSCPCGGIKTRNGQYNRNFWRFFSHEQHFTLAVDGFKDQNHLWSMNKMIQNMCICNRAVHLCTSMCAVLIYRKSCKVSLFSNIHTSLFFN